MPRSSVSNIVASTQTLSLLMVLAMYVVYISGIPAESYGLSGHSGSIMGDSWLHRLAFHFFHANVFHLWLNGLSLLTLAFFYEPPLWKLLLAFSIASLFPSGYIVPDLPIVGMSGTIYALMGLIFFQFEDKGWIVFSFLAYTAMGMFVGSMAVGLHTFCFIVGLIISTLTEDIIK